jgi:hypothetical protein
VKPLAAITAIEVCDLPLTAEPGLLISGLVARSCRWILVIHLRGPETPLCFSFLPPRWTCAGRVLFL